MLVWGTAVKFPESHPSFLKMAGGEHPKADITGKVLLVPPPATTFPEQLPEPPEATASHT
jgi:hypothetical protein